MSQIKRVNMWNTSHVQKDSRHKNEWVVSHKWTSHGAYTNESCHKYETSHVINMKWVMSHIWISHDTNTNTACHTYECVMSLMRMSRVMFEWDTSHIWMSHVTNMKWVTSHVWMSHVTHVNESCHTSKWVMSHRRNESRHTFEMSNVTHLNESCHAREWVVSHIWMSHVTHTKWVTRHIHHESRDVLSNGVMQQYQKYSKKNNCATISKIHEKEKLH